MRGLTILLAVLATGALRLAGPAAAGTAPQEPDYRSEIAPLLERHCVECHGHAQQKAGLRLDQRAAALAGSDFGVEPVLIAGDRDASLLYELVSLEDPDERMPPGEDRAALTTEERELLGRWIDAGMPWPDDGKPAEWPTRHWAYTAPQRPDVPAAPAGLDDWARTEVDLFLLAAMQESGLRPSPEAPREQLLRRAALDLTGLPPDPQELADFLADEAPDAWERALERLLASPHYGEQQARHWLDLARYADSNGYEKDDDRSMWPWRDWVIGAYNRDLPFDRFTIEQFAGDLLPDATLEQRVATGFHRNTMTNLEGGTDPEEFRVAALVDRVNTTGEVWLGATLGCVQCHDHKYDPYTQRDYYRMFALLNDTADAGNRNQPMLAVPTAEQAQRIAAIDAEVGALRAALDPADVAAEARRLEWAREARATLLGEAAQAEVTWLEDAVPHGAMPEGDWQPTAGSAGDAGSGAAHGGPAAPYSGERAFRLEAQGFRQFFFSGAAAPLRIGAGDRFYVHVWIDPEHPPRELFLQYRRPENDWEHRAYFGEDLQAWGEAGSPARLPLGALPESGRWVRLEVDAAAVGFAPGDQVDGLAFGQWDGRVWWDAAGLLSADSQVQAGVSDAVAAALRAWSGESADALPEPARAWYRDASRATEPQRLRIAELEATRPTPPTTLVLEALPEPRSTHVLQRGSHLSPGAEVDGGVPVVLDGKRRSRVADRLDLARWLVDPRNPVTARVTVNRIWRQVYGEGLVRTTDDFGTQGEAPSNPALLDWLASEFVARGWSVKDMYRLLMNSAAYRQSSLRPAASAALDPANRLLSWFPRRRLDAEELRDQALILAGQLDATIGGPPVYPPQPAGIDNATYAGDRWRTSQGGAAHRRGMYTFWRRTSPYPSFMLFDAPSRELSCARRDRSNTPLQALALLNEPSYVAAAEAFGARLAEHGLAWGFRACTGREAGAAELDVLAALQASDGWTSVAQVLLNLDETVTRG